MLLLFVALLYICCYICRVLVFVANCFNNDKMNRAEILAAAQAAESKVRIEEHREAVNVLRDKGYTWREIADFLNKQGVQTDHTRVYRTFGKSPQRRPSESRSIQIKKITYLGERKTKSRNYWNVMELELPSKLGSAITVVGYAKGIGARSFVSEVESVVEFRNATLVVKSGDRFPMAYIKLELKVEGDVWSAQEVYIMPKWEVLL